MENYYKLDFNDLEFWKLKENPKTNMKYYERVKESGSFYLEEKTPTMINGMICNFENIINHDWIRIRETDNSFIIEPSNITIDKSNLDKIGTISENVKIDPKLFRNINIDTFICNYISDHTRGCRSRISEEEVEDLREEFKNISMANNSETLSEVDFAFMFSSYMYNNGIYNFSRSDLMDFIYLNQDNPKYQSILENTKVYRHEHYDISDDLEFAFACLKYIGILHPDYEKDEPYEHLSIDDLIMSFSSIYSEKSNQFPEMEEFMDNYKKLLENRELKLKLYNGEDYV